MNAFDTQVGPNFKSVFQVKNVPFSDKILSNTVLNRMLERNDMTDIFVKFKNGKAGKSFYQVEVIDWVNSLKAKFKTQNIDGVTAEEITSKFKPF